MPKMRETARLRDCANERPNIITTTASERKVDCYLHGMRPEEKVVSDFPQVLKTDFSLAVILLFHAIADTS